MNKTNKQNINESKNEDAEEILSKKGLYPGRILYYFRKLTVWAIFFIFMFLLRDLLGLIFMTFILGFMMYRINEIICGKINISRKIIITGLYLILVSLVTGMFIFIIPKVFNEAKEFNSNIPDLEIKIRTSIENIKTNNPELNQVFNLIASKEQISFYTTKFRNEIISFITQFLKTLYNVIITIILSIIFSFLILIDLTQVIHELKRIQSTKLKIMYNNLAHPIVRFCHILGLAFEAQTIIAIMNTLLTITGMLILGIEKTAFLGLIVFLCSFIPVLGVFISSLPIVIVAFNSAGIYKTIMVIILIFIIHMIEAYILNPRIYAQHMKINPVFVLIILFLGHHLFGIWGMLLGVPVIYFFMTYITELKSMIKREADQI